METLLYPMLLAYSLCATCHICVSETSQLQQISQPACLNQTDKILYDL